MPHTSPLVQAMRAYAREAAQAAQQAAGRPPRRAASQSAYVGDSLNSNAAADRQPYNAAQEEEKEKLLRRAAKQHDEERKRERQRAAAAAAGARDARGDHDNQLKLRDGVVQLVERDRLAIEEIVKLGTTGLDDVIGIGDAVAAMRAAVVYRFTMPPDLW